MIFTKSMIMDFFTRTEIVDCTFSTECFSFCKVMLLSHDSEPLKPEVLYIGTIEQLEKLRAADYASVCVLCAAEISEVERFRLQHRISLLVLPAGTDIFSAANIVFDGFNRLNTWEQKVRNCIIAGKGFEELAELGKDVFGENPLVFGNPTYNIVGCSLSETPYNKNVDGLLRRKYFVTEEADTLAKMGYQTHLDSYMEAVLINPPTLMGCSFFLLRVSKVLRRIAFIAVYFVKDTPTEGLLDIFRQYGEIIRDHCRELESARSSMPSKLELFMDDLLQHTHSDEGYLADRAKQLGIPADESYRLGVIQWDAYSKDQADFVLWRIRSTMSTWVFRVIRFHESVLLIMKGSNAHDEVMEKFHSLSGMFADILDVCKGHIGLSTEVFSLMKLNVAYMQACTAIRFGRLLSQDGKIHFYSTYYIYDMIDAYSTRISVDDMYVQKLRLLDTPGEGKYNNLYLLRCYLLSERNLSVTARILHLHRNSVIYRVGKIESVLGVNLNDPDVRLRLMISYRILEMRDGLRLPPVLDDNEDMTLPSEE